MRVVSKRRMKGLNLSKSLVDGTTITCRNQGIIKDREITTFVVQVSDEFRAADTCWTLFQDIVNKISGIEKMQYDVTSSKYHKHASITTKWDKYNIEVYALKGGMKHDK